MLQYIACNTLVWTSITVWLEPQTDNNITLPVRDENQQRYSNAGSWLDPAYHCYFCMTQRCSSYSIKPQTTSSSSHLARAQPSKKASFPTSLSIIAVIFHQIAHGGAKFLKDWCDFLSLRWVTSNLLNLYLVLSVTLSFDSHVCFLSILESIPLNSSWKHPNFGIQISFKIMLAGVHLYMMNPDSETSYEKITTCLKKRNASEIGMLILLDIAWV